MLFGHVLFAIIWMGGAVYLEALAANAKRRADPLAVGVMFRDTAMMNLRLFTIAGGLVILTGLWLVVLTGWKFENLWVAISIVLVGTTVTIDLFYTAPRTRAALDLIDERGAADADVRELIDQVFTAGHIRLGLLLAVLFLMIFRP